MSPRYGAMIPPKSFAQHLLEIEREAARAATRVRGANARAAQTYADPPFSASRKPAGESSATGARLATAEEARQRATCETLVLRRTIPDLEVELDSYVAMLRSALSAKSHMAKRTAEQRDALGSSQEAEARLTQEVSTLRATNAALTKRVAALERAAATAAAAVSVAPPRPVAESHSAMDTDTSAVSFHSAGAAQQYPASAARVAASPAPPASASVETASSAATVARNLSAAVPAAAPPPPPPPAPPARAHPQQEEILCAAVALAVLEARLTAGGRPEHEAALAAASAAAAQMLATPPPDNDTRAAWVRYAASVQRAPAECAAVREALHQSAGWADDVLSGADAVVDANLPQLREHLRSVLNDNTATAVRDLQARAAVGGGAGVSEPAAADAASRVLASIRAAVGSVEEQFTVGLLAALEGSAATTCPEALRRRLCARTVARRCEKLAELLSHAELSARVLDEVRVGGSALAASFSAMLARAGGRAWLERFVLGQAEVGAPEELAEFIATQVRRDARTKRRARCARRVSLARGCAKPPFSLYKIVFHFKA